jgi:uncharacterized protein (DUF1684 family)
MTAFEVADWRRSVFALYAEVRAASEPASGHELWKAGRDRLFAHHPSTPLLPDDLADFTGLPVAPYDPSWRFEAELLEAEPLRLDVETGTDGIVPFERIGCVSLPEIGSLDVWRLASYGGGIFVPVRDALAGKTGGTYGGGRYLLDTVKGADLGPGWHPESLVLDFNFAYNPSCAYDPAWACPLAPKGNVMAMEIPVGERYSGSH